MLIKVVKTGNGVAMHKKINVKEFVALTCGKWEIGACARLGGNMIYMRYDGEDIFRPLEDEEQILNNPYIQGSPILLPANRTYLGKFSFEGCDYELPITEPRTNSHLHGLVHRAAFNVVSVGENEIVMSYSNTGEVYPFDFDMTVTYSVDDDGVSQKYVITNTGKKNMPYTFCLHSTFAEPDEFIMPVKCRQEDFKDIPTGKFIPLTEQEEKYNTGSPSKNLHVCGYYVADKKTARIGNILYTVSDNFDCWITYNARGLAGYICIEPQAGLVNGLNIDGGCPILAPGESVEYTTRYTAVN